MIEINEIKIIEIFVKEFFEKMTIPAVKINVQGENETVSVKIILEEPQILIGQGGQTLFEIQRVIRMMVNKKLQKVVYVDLDINNYKSQKEDYLKDLAKDLADRVAKTREEKVLSPMPAYERRILHKELADRIDIISESQGEGAERHIIIKPK